MARDIKTQGLQNPLQGQTGGFSNAQIYSPSTAVDSEDFNFMRDVAPQAGKILSDVMAVANNNAFQQGQADQAADMLQIGNSVDSAAALIGNASWLTKRAYTQGVKFREYSEGQLETQAAIQKQAQASVSAGDSLETFSQKIKPNLAKLNKTVHDFGLRGKAKELALDQMMSYTVSAQKEYQQAAEVRAKVDFDRGLAQRSSSATSAITTAQSPDDVAQALDSLHEELSLTTMGFDPKNSQQDTAAQMLGVVKEFTGRAKPASQGDTMRLDTMMGWMYNSPEAKKLPVETRDKMMDELTKYQGKVHEFNYNQVRSQIDDAYVSFKTTGELDTAFIQNASNYIDISEGAGTTSLEHSRALRSYIARMYKAQDQGMPEQWVSLNGTGIEVDTAGVNRAKADKELLTQKLMEANGDPIGYIAAIAEGMGKGREGLIKLGAEGISQTFASRLSMSDEELEQDANAGIANRGWQTMGGMYKKLVSEGRFSEASKILAGIKDPSQKEAARQIWSKSGDTPQLGTDNSIVYERLYSALEAGTNEMYNVKFDGEKMFNDGFFGKFFTPLSADWNYNQSEQMKLNQADLVEETWHKYAKGYMQANGVKLARDDGGMAATMAMLEHGFLVATKTQMLGISPEQRLAAGGSEGVAISDERLTKGIDGLAEDFINQIGDAEKHAFGFIKNKVDRENIHAQMTNNGVILSAMDDDGNSIGSGRHYTYGELYRLTKDPDDVSITSTGDIKTPDGKFIVEADDGTFGTNSLRMVTMKHMFVQEGFNRQLIATDKGRPSVKTFGHGILPSTAVEVLGQQEANDFIESAKNGATDPTYNKLFNKFFTGYYKTLGSKFDAAGLPRPTANDTNTLKYQPTYVAIADAMYHGGASGGGNAMVKIINLARSDKKAAKALLQQQQFYIQAGNDSGRKEFLMRAVDAVN